MAIRKQTPSKSAVSSGKIREYKEIVAYLTEHWSHGDPAHSLARTKKLDAALGNPSKKVSSVIVSGTNGKSLTVHLAAKLLKEEGLSVGAFISPHILTYNERISHNSNSIDNSAFTEVANEVINAAESLGLDAHSSELLTIMALAYFAHKKVDVALLESFSNSVYKPLHICTPLVTTITRVTPHDLSNKEEDLVRMVEESMELVKKGTWVVTGDQSKANIEHMQKLTTKKAGLWAMPIRKLAPLSYPFEQLHGRCAALAERIAQLFVDKHFNANATITVDSLLSRKKSKRGRPTLEDKRKAEIDPRKTLEGYWQEEKSDLQGRFQVLDNEEPSILLDTSSNIDAFKNVLLGLRLLHYNRPLKGLALVMAAPENALHGEEFLKLVRYFFKKTAGQIFICPLSTPLAGAGEEKSWNVEKVTNDIKSMKVKAHGFKTFEEAFTAAKKSVDQKDGLICITGSRSVIATYWNSRGITTF